MLQGAESIPRLAQPLEAAQSLAQQCLPLLSSSMGMGLQQSANIIRAAPPLPHPYSHICGFLIPTLQGLLRIFTLAHRGDLEPLSPFQH